MTLLTLIKYLFGSREAILRLAGCRAALALGLLLVLVAGLAREYDGEDLLHEPWHLLIPLAASVASSAVLYLLIRGVARIRGCREPLLLQGYLDFLGLYWMTAPLALLYAIPFERFLSAGDSVRANLGLLGLVAAWRVLLISRVVSVIYSARFWESFLVVMLFADSVLVLILVATPLPIVGIMGGIRLSEAEAVLHNVGRTLCVLGVLSWPIWFIGAWIAAALPVFFPAPSRQPAWQYLPIVGTGNVRIARHVWGVAWVAVAMWAFILPMTQPAQQLRWRVEQVLRAGRIHEGLTAMSAHEPGDFPPYWDPPPRIAYRERLPDITNVQEHLDVLPVKPWVRAIYVEKFGNWLRGEYDFGVWTELPPEEVERRIALIERMPERNQIIRDHQHGLQNRLGRYSGLPVELEARIQKLLDEAGVAVPSFTSPDSTLAPDAPDQQSTPTGVP